MIRHPAEQQELSVKWFFIYSLQETQTAIWFSLFLKKIETQDKCVLQTWLMVVEDDCSRVSQRKNLTIWKLHLPVWWFWCLFVFPFYWFSTHGFLFHASRDTLELLWCDYRALNHSAARDEVMWLFRNISLQRKPNGSYFVFVTSLISDWFLCTLNHSRYVDSCWDNKYKNVPNIRLATFSRPLYVKKHKYMIFFYDFQYLYKIIISLSFAVIIPGAPWEMKTDLFDCHSGWQEMYRSLLATVPTSQDWF